MSALLFPSAGSGGWVSLSGRPPSRGGAKWKGPESAAGFDYHLPSMPTDCSMKMRLHRIDLVEPSIDTSIERLSKTNASSMPMLYMFEAVIHESRFPIF